MWKWNISYYPCENEITNCSKCYYDIDQNKTKCFLCNNNNSFLFIGKDICLSKDKINQSYFYINETHINKCSNSINNCEECENNNTCSRCTNDFQDVKMIFIWLMIIIIIVLIKL